MEITGKTIAAFWSRVTDGTRLTCIGNTYRGEEAIGITGTVTKPGKTSIGLSRDDGRSFWIYPPKTVSGVVALTDDTITYRIDKRGDHTATWKILPPFVDDGRPLFQVDTRGDW